MPGDTYGADSVGEQERVWTNAEVIADLKKDYPGTIPEGVSFCMADIEQVYTLRRHEYRRGFKGKSYLVYVWDAPCAVCGEDFETITRKAFTGLNRTCPAHHGQFRSPARLAAPRPLIRQNPGEGSIYESAVCKAVEALSLVQSEISAAALVKHCMATLPRPRSARDTRKQSVVRALRNLHRKGTLPAVWDAHRDVICLDQKPGPAQARAERPPRTAPIASPQKGTFGEVLARWLPWGSVGQPNVGAMFPAPGGPPLRLDAYEDRVTVWGDHVQVPRFVTRCFAEGCTNQAVLRFWPDMGGDHVSVRRPCVEHSDNPRRNWDIVYRTWDAVHQSFGRDRASDGPLPQELRAKAQARADKLRPYLKDLLELVYADLNDVPEDWWKAVLLSEDQGGAISGPPDDA